MGDVIVLPVIRIERYDDGGRARLKRRRERLGLSEPMSDLTQRHADPEEPYNAPPCDCA